MQAVLIASNTKKYYLLPFPGTIHLPVQNVSKDGYTHFSGAHYTPCAFSCTSCACNGHIFGSCLPLALFHLFSRIWMIQGIHILVLPNIHFVSCYAHFGTRYPLQLQDVHNKTQSGYRAAPKCVSCKNPCMKIELLPRDQNPLSYYTL